MNRQHHARPRRARTLRSDAPRAIATTTYRRVICRDAPHGTNCVMEMAHGMSGNSISPCRFRGHRGVCGRNREDFTACREVRGKLQAHHVRQVIAA